MSLSAYCLTYFLPIFVLLVNVSEGRIVNDLQPHLGETFYGEIRELLRRRLNNIENDAPILENEQPPHPEENPSWRGPQHLGEISGVAVDPTGRPVVFHRGHHTWKYSTFNSSFHYQDVTKGPILQDTVLTLDPSNGEIIDSWGKGIFYMPHGLHIDVYGNVWLTDVALHQVFKFRRNARYPSLVLGERFQPGRDSVHFCQPTNVAVAPAGEIIVADGYCNNRIMVFNAAGGLLEVIPQPGEFLSLQVPHGLAILPDLDVVCIADRENMRVTCPNVGLMQSRTRSPPLTIQQPDLGRVFDVAPYGNYIYAVNGPTSPMIPIRGFTLDPRTERIIDHWSPLSSKFGQPHGVAVSPNGTALYVVQLEPNKVWKFDLVRSFTKK
ncbi:peptidyl-alpha-hydroxyglycine alpha-amidating lyase 2 [Athalia rosae]|uniref:peptidyl-alpha-hydroxyglycine alpha-amidating lyase 2 n=1 Tax=Athalia rosae TaxID=37344 RepID=UPI00203400E4|nr:peptidyl-alpha-hydroxyglycine alpha-amidating lyase 2 [Athalia rosae]